MADMDDAAAFWGHMFEQVARSDPALLQAMTRRPPAYQPAFSYQYCPCCGRIAKGTPQPSGFPCGWLAAIVGILKFIYQSLSIVAHNFFQMTSRFDPITIEEIQALLRTLWLTSTSPDAYDCPAMGQSYVERQPRRNKKKPETLESLRKPSGLRSTTGELVRSIEPSKLPVPKTPVDSQPVLVSSNQSTEPVDAVHIVNRRSGKTLKEGT